MSYGSVAKGAASCCGCSFHFPEKRQRRTVAFSAIAVKVVDLFRDRACAKSKKTLPNFFVEAALVDCRRCERLRHKRDLFV